MEDAWSPNLNQIGVEVALAAVPKLVVGVQLKLPEPPQALWVFERVPTVSNVAQPAMPPAEETMRLVVEAVPVIVKLVEVALVSSVLPKSVVEPSLLEAVELKAPAMVVEAVTYSEPVEVALLVVALPRTVSVPLAFSAPPTLRSEARVVEEVTANVPVEVAPVVVRPPLNCWRWVKVLKSPRRVEEAAAPAVTVPQTIVPFELVLSALLPEQVPKVEASVVEPVLEMEKRVEVAKVAVDDPMAKSVVLVSPPLAWIEESAKGEVVPIPTWPVLVMRSRSLPAVFKRISAVL